MLLSTWIYLCVLQALLEPSMSAPPSPSTAPLDRQQAEAKCAAYKELYTRIDADLATWQQDGISLELQQQTVQQLTTRARSKGFVAGFHNGTAYLLDEINLQEVGHHAQMLFVYLRLLVYLQEQFQMPDVDFVVNTIDRPLGLNLPPSSSDLPVLRFCKTASHTDILIPIFHFYMKDFDGGILDQVPAVNDKYPWKSKRDIVFGRFSLYARHFHPDDPAVPPREGANGTSICTSSATVTGCSVRSHFVQWAKQHKEDVDVSNARRIKMTEHGQYKYLIHLDGQGLSSRLDQLLPLNSLVMKEESGYIAFYHHLIKPYEHYVPFWKRRPEEVLDVLKWAREHDDEAQRIAANGQQLALKYLNKHARACYWYTLLTELSKLLRYKPGNVAGRQYMGWHMPVQQYLETIAKAHEGGKVYRSFVKKFTP